MEINGYNRKKRFDIKKWLTGSNSLIYLFILILLLVALLFVLNTVLNMRKDNKADENVSQDETEFETASLNNNTTVETTTVAENQSYYIKVSKNNNFLIIYKLDDNNMYTNPVKAFKVSVGKEVKTGITSIAEKSNWRKVNDYLYSRFASRLSNSECLYSASYYSQHKDNLNPNSYNNIGNTVSEGSVFMTATNAKWIYENCGVNTTVEILEDFAVPDGIELEEFEKISSNAYRDPLDNIK